MRAGDHSSRTGAVERFAVRSRVAIAQEPPVSNDFKYQSREDLVRDAEALGLDIRVSDDLSPLAEPVVVGGRAVGNRLAIQPMEGCDGTLEGRPDELTFRRYVRFGAGGAKLIWGEAAAVVPEGRANPRQLLIGEATARTLERMLKMCRDAHVDTQGQDDDLLVGLQLTHAGRYSYQRPILAQHDPILGPRTVVDRSNGATAGPDEPLITDDELDQLQDRFAEAAKLAFRIGFDFIDLKQCHRYLLSELLSAKTRPGKYGGSFENRTRFIRDLVVRVRDENPGRLIATRMNCYDGIPWMMGPEKTGIPCPHETPIRSSWGTSENDHHTPDLTEPIRLIGMLHELGVSLVNVSMGNPYASPHITQPYEHAPPDGYETPEHPLIGVDRHFRVTEAIQNAYPELPVVGSGYSWLQAFALDAGAANVRDRRVTFVGIGRGALSQPDFPRLLKTASRDE